MEKRERRPLEIGGLLFRGPQSPCSPYRVLRSGLHHASGTWARALASTTTWNPVTLISLPELHFKLFGRTILVLQKKVQTGQSTQEESG